MTTACTQCAKRKTRCDLVTEAGCHRCQVLRTDCSLKQEEVAPVPSTSTTARDRIQLSVSSEREHRRPHHDRLRSRSPSYYESFGRTGTSTTARLDQVESRLDRLDRLVRGARLGAGRPAVSSTTDEPLDWRKMGLLAPLSISSMAYLAMGLRQATFEDPVESGTVSRAEWTAIYERFWMSFNKILPIQDLGLAPSIAPEHPFVRTASLYYLACVRDSDPLSMTDRLRRSIYTFTTEQVCLALQCPPTLDVVLAMLILSYASVRQVEDATGFADPFRAAALGLDMAIELGLDDTAEKLRSAEAAELLMFDASILRKACLWYAICNRHVFTKIMNSASLRPGRRTPATTPPVPLMSALASGSDLLAQLVVESELLGLVNDTLLACQAYRAESTFSGILLERYYRELGQSVKDLDRFRRTIRQKLLPNWPFLLTQSYYVSHAITSQGNIVSQTTPSPMAAHVRYRYLGIWGLEMIAAAADLLEHLITEAPALSTMPGIFVPPIYLLIAGYRSWRLGEVLNNMDPPRMAPDLDAVARMLRQSHAGAGFILHRIATMRIQLSEADVRQEAVPPPQDSLGGSGLVGVEYHHDHQQFDAPYLVPGRDPAPVWADNFPWPTALDLGWMVDTEPWQRSNLGDEQGGAGGAYPAIGSHGPAQPQACAARDDYALP